MAASHEAISPSVSDKKVARAGEDFGLVNLRLGTQMAEDSQVLVRPR